MKPIKPIAGDISVDAQTFMTTIFDGQAWHQYTSPPKASSVTPTSVDLEKYPSLKVAWEEYLSIKKLLGV